MTDRALFDAVAEAIRIVIIVGFPLTLACLVAGVLMGVFQSATSIHEPVLGYAAKLGAIAVVLYLMLPRFSGAVMSLAERVFR